MPSTLPRRLVRPHRLPPLRVGLGARVRLSAEILIAYVELLSLLRKVDVRAMVEGARCARVEPTAQPRDAEKHLTAVRVGNMVERVLTKLPTDRRCLIKSLVVVRVLSHRGIESRVVIGVQTGEEGFRAHAWVEYEEHPVLPPLDYEPLLKV